MYSDKSRLFLCDKNRQPIFAGQKLTNGRSTYRVIADSYFGLSLQEIKTRSIEMLTREIAIELTIVKDESLFNKHFPTISEYAEKIKERFFWRLP